MEANTSFVNPFLEDIGPIHQSCIDRFERVDASKYHLPKIRVDLYHVTHVLRFKKFANDMDNLYQQCHLPLLDRREMEGLWWALLKEKSSIFDARTLEGSESDERKLRLKQNWVREALDQRNWPKVEEYLLEKKVKFPMMDVEQIGNSDGFYDHRAGLVKEWALNVKDSVDPAEDPYLRTYTAEQLEIIKGWYEEDVAAVQDDAELEVEAFEPIILAYRMANE